jgi:hypothetical protein
MTGVNAVASKHSQEFNGRGNFILNDTVEI